MPRRTLYISLAFAVIVFFLHTLAMRYYLYWRIWWYDIPVHFFGGVMLGALVLWFLQSLQERGWMMTHYTTLISTLSFVLFGGMMWEFYEYSMGFTFNTLGSYPLDVVKDLLVDILGGLVVYWFLGFSIVHVKKHD
jgi:hypothetical protein